MWDKSWQKETPYGTIGARTQSVSCYELARGAPFRDSPPRLSRGRKIAHNLSHPGPNATFAAGEIKSHVAYCRRADSDQHELKVRAYHRIKRKLSYSMVHLQGFEPGTH